MTKCETTFGELQEAGVSREAIDGIALTASRLKKTMEDLMAGRKAKSTTFKRVDTDRSVFKNASSISMMKSSDDKRRGELADEAGRGVHTKAIEVLRELEELENIETYHDGIVEMVQLIKNPEITTSTTLAFVEATIEEILGDGTITVVSGAADAKKNTVVISKDTDVDAEAGRFVEDWYLKGTAEGIRLSTLDDQNEMYKRLKQSAEYKKFVDENKRDVAAKLLTRLDSVVGTHTLAHEMIHVGAKEFMTAYPEHAATKKVKALYKEALEYKTYIDEVSDSEYWAKNVDEFIVEGLSNPRVMKALQSISADASGTRLVTVFRELVDSLLKMVGITNKSSVYAHLLDGFIAMIETQSANKIEAVAVAPDRIIQDEGC